LKLKIFDLLNKKAHTDCLHGQYKAHNWPSFRPSANISTYKSLIQLITLTMQDMLMTLSTLLRGSIYEKLRWTFKLYDLNGDGCITRSELSQIVLAIHELMGKRPQVRIIFQLVFILHILCVCVWVYVCMYACVRVCVWASEVYICVILMDVLQFPE